MKEGPSAVLSRTAVQVVLVGIRVGLGGKPSLILRHLCTARQQWECDTLAQQSSQGQRKGMFASLSLGGKNGITQREHTEPCRQGRGGGLQELTPPRIRRRESGPRDETGS